MPTLNCLRLFLGSLLIGVVSTCAAAEPDTSRGERMITAYFKAETRRLADACLSDVHTLKDWTSRRETYRRQLLEMLGLDPLPERTDLQAQVTGTVDHDEFTVENVQFQSRPGLYVTGNLYVPKKRQGPLPAILYVCGHARVVKDGVSYGNKSHYQHHGGWFARNGYVCLTIDTLQLGEIEGTHHGTYGVRKPGGGYQHQWSWNSRGYTPAGVEAWNCVRALDYLQSRKEVDPERIGVTGRSGGGAYSWWIAAIDDRIKAAVPVAGITDLQNHVVDGCVEGHCDCMYDVNTYRWDYAQVAALVAPRPLLISNSDKDRIFPLDGVVRLHSKVRKIYELYGKPGNLGLQITEGPHRDTQELRVAAFHWFNRFLKGDDPLIETAATPLFEPKQLKVFDQLPSDQRNTTIHDSFVPVAVAAVPEDAATWRGQRKAAMTALKEKVFRGWPAKPGPLNVKPAFDVEKDGVRFAAYDFTSQDQIGLRLYVAHRAGLKKFDLVVLNALDEQGWTDLLSTMRVAFADQLRGEAEVKPDKEAFQQTQGMFKSFPWVMAYVAPRGIGPTAWNPAERYQTQVRRRFMLLGQTLDGMRVYDVTRAAAALRTLPEMKDTQLWMQGERDLAGVTLYAALCTPHVHRLDLHHLPRSHTSGPQLLNVLRFLDIPQAVALAAERSQVRIYEPTKDGWDYPQQVAKQLDWDKKQLQVRVIPAKASE